MRQTEIVRTGTACFDPAAKTGFSKISSYLWREFEHIQTMFNLSCLTQEIE
jgi:hypothetical protein